MTDLTGDETSFHCWREKVEDMSDTGAEAERVKGEQAHKLLAEGKALLLKGDISTACVQLGDALKLL